MITIIMFVARNIINMRSFFHNVSDDDEDKNSY